MVMVVKAAAAAVAAAEEEARAGEKGREGAEGAKEGRGTRLMCFIGGGDVPEVARGDAAASSSSQNLKSQRPSICRIECPVYIQI